MQLEIRKKIVFGIISLIVACITFAVIHDRSTVSRTSSSEIKPITNGQEASIKSDAYYIEQLCKSYASGLADAMNNNDFSAISNYLLQGSPLYNLQKQSFSEANDGNVKMKFITSKIEDFKQTGAQEFKVDVYEEYEITFKNGKKEIGKFYWKYSVDSKNGWKLTNCEENKKPIYSEQAQATPAKVQSSQQSSPKESVIKQTDWNFKIVKWEKGEYLNVYINGEYIGTSSNAFYPKRSFVVRKSGQNVVRSINGNFNDEKWNFSGDSSKVYQGDRNNMLVQFSLNKDNPIGYVLYYDYAGELVPIYEFH